MMRFIFFILIVFASFGCTLEDKTPLHAESIHLSQNDDQVILTVVFSGNIAPEQASGKLLLLTNDSKTLYDREFTIKKGDFKKLDSFILERYIKLDTNEKFDYAELYLYLPNQTFHAEQGTLPGSLDINAEAIAHENQYTTHIDFTQAGRKIKPTGSLELRIVDPEGTVYKQNEEINETKETKDDYLTFFLPYNRIPKSFYNKGNLIIKFSDKEKRLEIPLKQYNEKEKLQIEDLDFSSNAKPLANYIEYVGFSFNVTRAGYYFAHLPQRTALTRFDVKIKNLLGRPQYLIRDDFYSNDLNRNFYPVYFLSTKFNKILKAKEEVNVSFYFNVIGQQNGYLLFYGDKKLAELNN